MKTDLTVVSRGRTYPVELDGDGLFCVTIEHSGKGAGHSRIQGASLPELKKALDKATKAQIDVGFTYVAASGYGLKHTVSARYGTVTGKHATNSSFLVRWEDGDSEQLRSYKTRDALVLLDGDERDRLEDLVAACNAANQALAAFAAAHPGNLDDRVREALES